MEDAERVTVAFLVATAALEQGKSVVIWTTKDAVRLALPGEAKGEACDGCPPLAALSTRSLRLPWHTRAGGISRLAPRCGRDVPHPHADAVLRRRSGSRRVRVLQRPASGGICVRQPADVSGATDVRVLRRSRPARAWDRPRRRRRAVHSLSGRVGDSLSGAQRRRGALLATGRERCRRRERSRRAAAGSG